jgi:hypothetical protein
MGLAADNAEPIHVGENAIFRLPGGIVIRISRPRQQAAAQREVAVSRWLNASRVAAVVALATAFGVDAAYGPGRGHRLRRNSAAS